jgi:hypothetical protein
MHTIKNIAVLAPVFFILFGHRVIESDQVQVVSGTVVSDKTGKAVVNAHVYIIDGEDEALTNAKGEFSIRTSQKLPVTLTVEHTNYQKTSISVSNALQKQVIRLQARQP